MSRVRPSVLLTGGHGRLAMSVAPAFARADWHVVAPGHAELDVTRPDEVVAALRRLRPAAVVNLAAWTDVDACEADPARAALVNTGAVGVLAEGCREIGARLCSISSDYVFDGTARRPYDEDDTPAPRSAYGRSKLSGELIAGEDATIVRSSWISGLHGRSFVRTVLDQASDPSRVLRYVTDQVGSPTVADDAAEVIVRLVTGRQPGTFHVANTGVASCFEFARHVLFAAGEDPDRVAPITTADLLPPRRAHRPAFSALATSRLPATGVPRLRDWREAVTELVVQMHTHDLGVLARHA